MILQKLLLNIYKRRQNIFSTETPEQLPPRRNSEIREGTTRSWRNMIIDYEIYCDFTKYDLISPYIEVNLCGELQKNEVLRNFDSYNARNTRYRFDRVVKVDILSDQNNPLRGRTYIQLPIFYIVGPCPPERWRYASLHLSENILSEAGGNEIDSVDDLGIATAMKGLVLLNNDIAYNDTY
ncbi:hypothetical protein PGB90_002879 [Kerria lacca]